MITYQHITYQQLELFPNNLLLYNAPNKRWPIAFYTIYLLFVAAILEAILNYRFMQGLPDFNKLLRIEHIIL